MSTLGAADHHDPAFHTSRTSVRRRTGSVSQHSTISSTNDHDPSSSSSEFMTTRPGSSSSSKALLTMALLEAQSAVQLDNANDISAALDAYGRAVNLLGKVMEASSSADEQERLRTIHDSYLFRIHLLSTPPTTTSIVEQQRPTTPASSMLHSAPNAAIPPPPHPQQPLPPPPRSGPSGNESDAPPRRVKKQAPAPLPLGGPILPPSEPRTPRHRSDSVSADTSGEPRVRHHTRSHTGGSTHRSTDLASERIPGVPKVRSRDHLGVPIHSAPTTPLPPLPSGSAPGSGATSPNNSNPPTPNMTGNQTFMSSLGAYPPTSPPPRTPLPQVPSNLTSPPASPAHATRRTSPLVPSLPGPSVPAMAPPQHQSVPPQPKSLMSPPEEQKRTDTSRFYEDDLISDEWLPNLNSTFTYDSGDQPMEDALPERVASNGSYSASQLEQIRSKTQNMSVTGQDSTRSVESTPPQYQYKQQHQRSFSQSSTLSTHQPGSSQPSRSPLSGPMYSFQQGNGSMSSLHALENPSQSKRISDSARSIKEGSPLARSTVTGATSGQANGSPSSNGSPSGVRPATLQHQASSSKLSATLSSSSSSASPTMDKNWSPNLNGGQTTQGGMTLFDVISDDPFGGMSFPLPPPFIEPPPTDTHMRCFWLMHKLEQSMVTGGFLTKRMFVPRAIWYQSLVRLPAADSKTNACQTLTALFTKFVNTSRSSQLNLLVEPGPEGDMDRATILKELDNMESAAHQVQAKLSKKLSFIHRPGKSGNLTIGTSQGYQDDMQGPPTNGGGASIYGSSSVYGSAQFDWAGIEEPVPNQSTTSSTSPASTSVGADKSKKGGVSVGAGSEAGGGLMSQWKSFSKSVQKSMGNDKVDDTSAYTEAVIRLFQASYFLEAMLRHYSALTPFGTQLQIVNKVRRLADVLNQVICAFVVRDMGELMAKYMKRVGAWVAD
ncbi:hypothetical protein BGZ93_008530 [Podila epicladia]|nr:hypothetical protein BGZ92_002533 [Podila epicladia]KAG0092018.1 hypothetical protein BGZ93_008530 [Podila epicladia]